MFFASIVDRSTRVPPVSRARWAVAAMFFACGVVVGGWAPHIVLIQVRLGLSATALGASLLAMAVGAVVSMPFAGMAGNRFGSAAVARWSALATVVSFLLPIFAPSREAFVAGLFVLGAANGLMDVSMNAHGVLVERRLGRPIMSSLHAFFSLGGLTGAALAGLALVHVAPQTHAVAEVIGLAVLVVVAGAGLLPLSEDRGRAEGHAFALPDRGTLGVGLLTLLAFVSEGAMLDWSGIYLVDRMGTSPAFAATGYAAFSAAMTVGRFSGDRVRARSTAVGLVRTSAALAAVGLGAGLTIATPWAAIAGFTIAGLGLSNLVPVFFGAAGRSEQGSSHGIAAVATLGYAGFLFGPPLLGFVADRSGLGVALGLVALGCALIAVFGGVARRADD